MTTLSQFFSHLYTLTILFSTVIILKIVILIRSVSATANGRPITAAQYIRLIEAKNPVSRFRSGRSRTDSRECAVCLSIFEDGEQIRRLRCGHVFHKDCLDTWLHHDSATCPLCRSYLVPEEIVVSYRRWRNQPQEYDGSHEELVLLLSLLNGNYLRRFM